MVCSWMGVGLFQFVVLSCYQVLLQGKLRLRPLIKFIKGQVILRQVIMVGRKELPLGDLPRLSLPWLAPTVGSSSDQLRVKGTHQSWLKSSACRGGGALSCCFFFFLSYFCSAFLCLQEAFCRKGCSCLVSSPFLWVVS